jgi:hypothetical protein
MNIDVTSSFFILFVCIQRFNELRNLISFYILFVIVYVNSDRTNETPQFLTFWTARDFEK